MATLLLQAAGAFIGGFLGPVGTALGTAAGALAGYVVDRSLIESTRHYRGPRLAGQRPFSAEEGAPLTRLYGTARLGGTLIWATRFEEESRTTRQGIKGGPKVTEYAYYANAAFALCEGEIAGVRRIWADGREVDRNEVEIRIHTGTQDQPPDPLIEAKQGTDNAPAYRGVAYAVIDRFPIDDFGRRLPQFQFEVMRPVGTLNARIRAVALIPGATEYGFAPYPVRRILTPGDATLINRNMLSAGSDIEASLDELQMLCPGLETVALVVTWFGDDLRAGACRIRPMVTQTDPAGLSLPWLVTGLERQDGTAVSQAGGGAAFGGTPSDRSVMDAIAAIRARGLKVWLHPFIMMDVPADNGLDDPYGGAEQPAYPWRGRITGDPAPGRPGTADKTAAARAQIETFAGAAAPQHFVSAGDTIAYTGPVGDWGFRRFILHHARLAAAAGGVDGFLLGSEMRGVTALRDADDRFPFVETLRTLAGEARAMLGPDTLLTYGADWSEYFGHQPADGSGDVFFHLDPLWADPAIDGVGIDNYMPLSDWRDADHAGGNPDGFAGPYDPDGLAAGIAGGEGFDWYYAGDGDRAARLRTPITDGAYGKPWMFRYKDLVGWWSNPHHERVGGVERPEPTDWQPQGKPILFTELGCAASDKGPNQPNVFPDPKSSENAKPHFSNGGRSDLAQRRFLAAHLAHWLATGTPQNPLSAVYGGPMVNPGHICLWAWDARPFPAFPLAFEQWRDGENWFRGHWLNGRLNGVGLDDLIAAICADHGLPAPDVTHADGTLTGYVVDQPETARAALEPLVDLFALAVRQQGGALVFASEGRVAGAATVLDELVAGEEASLERLRRPDDELASAAQFAFRDPLREHQAASVLVRREDGRGGGTAHASLPAILETGAARSLATDWLRRHWRARDEVAFALPAAARAVHAGGLVRLAGDPDGEDHLVTEIEEGLTRVVRARRIARVAPTPWRADWPAAPWRTSAAAGPPHALLLDLPLASGAAAPHDQLRLAVRMRPWRSQVALVSPEETGFVQRTTVARRATIGTLAEPLGSGFHGRIDRAGALLVDLLDGELASASRLQLLNGANAVAVRSAAGAWEIVQFEEADEIAPARWRLTGLLRGQLGTDDAMAAGAPAGADVVRLDGAVAPAGLLASEIGLPLNWRIGPAGHTLSQDLFAGLTAAGGVRALTPLSPVHLAGRREAGGDLRISWIRRGRIDADGWAGTDIPLGEETESYRVAAGLAGGPVLRTANVAEPAWTYTAAAMTADFGGPPATLAVTVRQLSAAVGDGVPATLTLTLS